MTRLATLVSLMLLVFVAVLSASPALAEDEPEHVADQLIISFVPGVTDDQIEDFYDYYRLNEDDDLDAESDDDDEEEKLVGTPRGASKRSSQRLIDRLRQDPRTEYVEFNYVIELALSPDDPQLGSLWGLNNTGQTGGTIDADIDAPEAWNITTGSANVSPNVIVGVIDTGVNYSHQDLAANMWNNPGETGTDGNGNNKAINGIDDDGNGYIDDVHGINAITNTGNPMDDHSHGSHVAGTIGARGNDGVGVAGVNWTASIAACKFLSAAGSGTTANAVKCFKYFNYLKNVHGQNIAVTNNSWGGGGFSQALYDAMQGSDQPGMSPILHACAAGNGYANNDVSAYYPTNYNLDNIISVAATDHNDLYASFSNYGATTVEIAAPGVNVYSTATPGNSYRTYSGTSMATPHVVGVANLAWSVNPTLTAAEAKAQIVAGADALPVQTKKTITNGRLNALNSLVPEGPPDSTPPEAPTGLVTTGGHQKVDLSWSDNVEPDLANYRVYRAPVSGGAYTLVATVTAASYSDTGLANGNPYFYVLTATDTAGNESANSTEVSGTPVADVTPPDAPTGLIATAGDLLVNLDWVDNMEPDLVSYGVYRATEASGPYTQIGNVVVSNYTNLGLTHGTTYHYVVRAIDIAVNESSNSNQASATAVDLTPPATPTGVQTTVANQQVDLDWIDNIEPDLASYSVYRSTTSGVPYSLIDTVTLSNYTDTGLVNGTTYYYVVTATDIAGNQSNNSSEASATPWLVPPGSVTLNVTDGWDGQEDISLAAEGQIDILQTSDNIWWPTQFGEFTSFNFADFTIPAGANLSSVKVYVEHWKEDAFVNGLQWQIGTGWPNNPTVWATNNQIPKRFELNERTDVWNVTSFVDTEAKVNLMELHIANNDVASQQTMTDHVYAIVEWSGTNNPPPVQVIVPNVVALSQTAAETAITGAGLVPAVTTANDPNVPAGDVISQDPAGGASVDLGSTVGIVVSLGPVSQVIVPNVVALSQTAAETAITGAGLVPAVTTANDPNVPAGDVISQNPAGGASINLGSTVGIVVSLGPVLAAPTGLSATAGDIQVDLGWTSNSVGYNVYRSDTDGGPYTQVNASPINVPAYIDSGLVNGSTYYYVVTAVDAGSESGYSNQASATPSGGTPPGSETLTVVDGWDDDEGMFLSDDEKEPILHTSDDDWWATPFGSFTSYQFSDVSVPAGATITSVKVYVEHYEGTDFGSGGLEWQVGTGWPGSADVWGTNSSVPIRHTQANEGTDVWDVTTFLDSTTKLNSMELYIGNNDPVAEEEAWVDYIYAVVEWVP